MKIGLIDNDLVSRDNHNFPNLALMKLSSYHKSIGNEVELIGFNEIQPGGGMVSWGLRADNLSK